MHHRFQSFTAVPVAKALHLSKLTVAGVLVSFVKTRPHFYVALFSLSKKDMHRRGPLTAVSAK